MVDTFEGVDMVDALVVVEVVGAFDAVEAIGEVEVKDWENNTVADWEYTDNALPVLDYWHYYLGKEKQKTGH